MSARFSAIAVISDIKQPDGGMLDRARTQARLAFRNRLARRFVFLTLLASTFFAVIMTAVQLYFNYSNDRSFLESNVREVETSILPSLRQSLWLLDESLIQTQLDGLLQSEGIVYAEIRNAMTPFVTGDEMAEFDRVDVFEIEHLSGESRHNLGELVVRVSYDQVETRLLQLGVVVLTTNFVKAGCVALIILIIYQRLIGRHLTALASFVAQSDLRLPSEPLRLERQPLGDSAQDDLNLLEQAINHWVADNLEHVTQLQDAYDGQAAFAYAMSHDLKSPLNSMQMLIDELREECPLNREGEVIVGDMMASNDRMRRLVDGLLTYATTVSLPDDTSAVDLNDLLFSVLQDLAAEMRSARARVDIGRLPTLTGDPVQLGILFQNLISNAIKFRRADVPPVVSLTSRKEGECYIIEVVDNGIGIPQQRRDEVFDLFRRLHTHSDFMGSGLGLAICRRVVRNHGGTISVRPGEQHGTVFVVTL